MNFSISASFAASNLPLSLATWWDVLAVAKASGKFDAAKLAEIEEFMHDPAGWSKAHGGVATAAAE